MIKHSDAFDFLKSLPPESAQLVVIDPPYNMGKDKWDKFDSEEAFIEFILKVVDESINVLVPNGSLFLFNKTANCALLYPHLRSRLVVRNWIIWNRLDAPPYAQKHGFSKGKHESILFLSKSKTNYFDIESVRIPHKYYHNALLQTSKRLRKKLGEEEGWRKAEEMSNRGTRPMDVWDFPLSNNEATRPKRKHLHPTKKPLLLCERMVLSCTKVGDLVVDPFAGSGTFGIVCKVNNRKYEGCDSNEGYVKYANRKIERTMANLL